MMIDRRIVQRALIRERKLAGISQAEAAKRSGMWRTAIGHFETGLRIESIKLLQLERLLHVYGTDLLSFVERLHEETRKAEKVSR